MAKPIKKKAVIVTLDDAHSHAVEAMVEKCRAAGLDIHESLELLGQITGEIDPDKESGLRKIVGVLSVDESQDYQLPPPNSDTQ